MTMTKADTLAELLTNNRAVKRSITYIEGENAERVVGYGELYDRALGILFHLQKLGAKPGDKLIIYLANNEQFLDAFWAGMLGGIVPVPVALGISDEHKNKLLPNLDRGFSALLDDLAERGLLDETLIVWLGEFGRTPAINGAAGRDHWAACNTVLLAGAGIHGGTVFGGSTCCQGPDVRILNSEF